MPSDLKSGKAIRNTRGLITRKQTGKQARKNIKKKYGSVKNTSLYYHRGKGEWTQFSPITDQRRKSKKGRWTKRRMHKTDKRRSRI